MKKTTRRVVQRLLVVGVFLVVPRAVGEEGVSFPARAADLEVGSYWAVSEFSEGCCILDLNVMRWRNNSWASGSGGSTNAQDYSWGVPLYAPASGEIASCWRNFPDDPGPGQDHPESDRIFTGGNHVTLLTDDGRAVALAHFQAGSIPADLCPPNRGSTQFPSTLAKEGDWRVASYIEPGNRPRVHEGRYIGRTGTSGNSGGPHLHISIHDVQGTDSQGREDLSSGRPFRFRHGWSHSYEHDRRVTTDGWFRVRGGSFTGDPACPRYQANSPSCGFKMLHPSPYLRRADASAGQIKTTATLFVSGQRAVTASVGRNNDHLKLIAWDLVGVDRIIRKGQSEAGAVRSVVLGEPSGDYVLAAVRQKDNLLKMIAYRVTATGSLVRVDSKTAGTVSALEMATTTRGNDRSITAVRDGSGNLKLVVWDVVTNSNGTASIVRLGEASAGAVSELSIAKARHFDGVLTAVKTSTGALKVIPWKLSSNGQLTRGASAEAGRIGRSVAVIGLARGVAVAAEDSDGRQRVITWSTTSDGAIAQRRSTLVAGEASEVSLLRSPHGDSNFTMVVRDSGGDLRLLGWAVDGDGRNLRRLGSSKAGQAAGISADVVSRSYPGLDPRDMILTSLCDADGDLKLVTWDTNMVNP